MTKGVIVACLYPGYSGWFWVCQFGLNFSNFELGVVGVDGASSGYVPLLLASEASSFLHELLSLLWSDGSWSGLGVDCIRLDLLSW